MKILLINGTKRRQSTYHIALELIEQIGGNNEVKELFLPDACPEFCMGCGSCFLKGEDKCPHYKYTKAFVEDLEWADLYVFASPVFVYHTTGQMKALLDHFGYMWLVHRPNEKLFTKQAVVISTAAGAGTKSTNKDIADSLKFWGVSKIIKYGKNVRAVKWKDVNDKNKDQIVIDMNNLSKKIKSPNKVKANLRTKIYFKVMKKVHIKFGGLSPIDKNYWKNKGWLDKTSPF